ncbi:MAG: hypothetical protein D6721_03775 [Gammaproteobacteria bacterium]|nr:MAG: hypothetical protein D6721_03775 [Gammaproteobacteria bacterium]
MDTIERAVEKLEALGEAPAAPDQEAEPPASTLPRAEEWETSRDDRHQLIHIDPERLQAGGIVDPRSEQRDQLAEEFRQIKLPVLRHIRGETASAGQIEHPNLVMVTSSIAGEGKTFTAINLALSIAMEKDMTVLLVDADVAKPEVTTRLGIEAKQGLTDVLLGEARVEDVLLRTNIPKLTLMPSGRSHPHATELLASSAMRRLAEELSTRYADRVVIFDSPPLLMTSEARVLALLMGQILLVVEESRTPQPLVKEAAGLLQDVEVVGLVLNKAHRLAKGIYGGGYGYGYGYGHGRQGAH